MDDLTNLEVEIKNKKGKCDESKVKYKENVESSTRSRNFLPVERALLVDLIDIFKDVIENKRTDALNVKAKDDAWDELCKEFNSQTTAGIIRSTAQLKTCYKGIKSSARKNLAQDKVSHRKTGGGEEEPTLMDDVEIRVVGMLTDQFQPLKSPVDDDADDGDINEVLAKSVKFENRRVENDNQEYAVQDLEVIATSNNTTLLKVIPCTPTGNFKQIPNNIPLRSSAWANRVSSMKSRGVVVNDVSLTEDVDDEVSLKARPAKTGNVLFHQRPPSDSAPEKRVKLTDLKTSLQVMMDEKRSTAVQVAAAKSEVIGYASAEHAAKMKEMSAAAEHAVKIRDFEVKAKEMELDLQRELMREKRIDILMKEAQLAVLKKQLG